MTKVLDATSSSVRDERRAGRSKYRQGLLSVAVVFAAAIVTACGPSQEEYDQERAKVSKLQTELEDSKSRRNKLQTELDSVQAKNAAMISRLKALGQNVEELEGSLDETRRALEELRTRERQAQARLGTFRKLLERFQKMIESGKLRVRVVRNRMVVELPENVLFDSGKAKLKSEGQATLSEVAGVLKDLKSRSFQVAGHTDNVPISTRRFRSNWELSTARAVNVTKILIEKGMPRNSVSAAGYADTEPVASNDTTDGKRQNRRIEIVLVPNLDELPDLSSLEKTNEKSGPPATKP